MTDDLRPNFDEALVLDAIDRFLEREVRPHVHELEATDTWPAEIVEKMRELGLFGATIGEEYGGLGLPASTYAKIVERVSAVWMSVSGIFNSHLIMAAAVERFGSEAQKARYLPRFASGELRGGIALTEPDCGTDLQAIGPPPDATATATGSTAPRPDQQRHPGSHHRSAREDRPEGEPRHRGMSLLLIEKGEGFRVGRKLEKLGYKGNRFRRTGVRRMRGAAREPRGRARRPRVSSRSWPDSSSARNQRRRARGWASRAPVSKSPSRTRR